MRKTSLYLSLLLAAPLPLFAGSACHAANEDCAWDSLNSGTNGQFFVCTRLDPVTFQINMMNYGEVIANAVAGRPLEGAGTYIGTPACIAETLSKKWDNINELTQNFQIRVTFKPGLEPLDNSKFPYADTFHLIDMPLSAGSSNYYLGASMYYCPCGSYSANSCGTTPYPYPLGTPYTAGYNNPSMGEANLGWCSDAGTTGGVLLKVYTPNYQVPPIGTYEADLGIKAESVKIPLLPKP